MNHVVSALRSPTHPILRDVTSNRDDVGQEPFASTTAIMADSEYVSAQSILSQHAAFTNFDSQNAEEAAGTLDIALTYNPTVLCACTRRRRPDHSNAPINRA